MRKQHVFANNVVFQLPHLFFYTAVQCESCQSLDLENYRLRDTFLFETLSDVPVECFFVKCDGSLTDTSDRVRHGAVYSLEPRLRGGKGGFGSMLRALGAQIEKTTNREACRDLSGRRLRDVNHEKAMAEWVKQQAEREAEKEQKRLERLQRKLAEPRPCSANPAYQRQCHEMAERLEDSVLKGMQAASSKVVSAEIGESRKRPNKSKTDRGASSGKRKCFWLGTEGLETAEESSSETSDGDGEEAPGTSGVSFHTPRNGDGAEAAAESAGSCPRAGVQAADSRPPQAPGPGSGCAVSADAGPGRTSAGGREQGTVAVETEKSLEQGGAGGEEPAEEGAAGAGPTEETQAQTPEATDPAAEVAPGECGGSAPVTKPEDGRSGNTDTGLATLDLLAFTSAVEMEALGLDRLKSELTARGLKCGGTLRERAARLFSVRGLAREQMDPALFARPPRGKKK
ncbi:replication stress response regulator SDE2 isoform X2 [Panthera leo]|uniref:replication stress response regulator SDE2 isoform X2 n=1 Tax=Panthera leo TaxID=9689 RepID=UPI001C6A63EB|nr:replication stress response regulator SDE2 isoform X2 [Panthera leo]